MSDHKKLHELLFSKGFPLKGLLYANFEHLFT